MGNQGNIAGNKIKDIQQETDQAANGKPGTSYAEDTQKNIAEAEHEREQPSASSADNKQSGEEEADDEGK